MQTLNFNFPAVKICTSDHEAAYSLVAAIVARSNDPLAELVRLMEAIKTAGVDLSLHLDCLVDALCEEGEG